MRRNIFVIFGAAALVLSLVGCGSPNGTASTTPTSEPTTDSTQSTSAATTPSTAPVEAGDIQDELQFLELTTYLASPERTEPLREALDTYGPRIFDKLVAGEYGETYKFTDDAATDMSTFTGWGGLSVTDTQRNAGVDVMVRIYFDRGLPTDAQGVQGFIFKPVADANGITILAEGALDDNQYMIVVVDDVNAGVTYAVNSTGTHINSGAVRYYDTATEAEMWDKNSLAILRATDDAYGIGD